MTGYIGFSFNRSSWISKIIRFFREDMMEDAPSHTFLTFGAMHGEIMLGEASDPRIRIYPLAKYLNKEKRFEIWEISNIDYEKKVEVIRKLMPITGARYGYLKLLGFIFIWAGNKLGIRIDNPVKGGMVCSSYVFHALKEMGYEDEELMNMNPNNVAPDSIKKSIRRNPNCRLVMLSDFDSEDIIHIE